MLVGRRDLIFGRPHRLTDDVTFHCRLHDQHHVVAAGVMLRIRRAVRVGKMRIYAAEFLRTFVHERDESLDGAGNVLGKRLSDLVRRSDEQPEEAVPDGHRLTLGSGDGAAALCQFVAGTVGEEDRFIQVTALGGQQGGHDFRDAGRSCAVESVLAVQDRPGLCFRKDREIRSNFRSLRKFDGCGKLRPDRFRSALRCPCGNSLQKEEHAQDQTEDAEGRMTFHEGILSRD